MGIQGVEHALHLDGLRKPLVKHAPHPYGPFPSDPALRYGHMLSPREGFDSDEDLCYPVAHRSGVRASRAHRDGRNASLDLSDALPRGLVRADDGIVRVVVRTKRADPPSSLRRLHSRAV
jgi:hypothetical protein